jgi:hypothetical protein
MQFGSSIKSERGRGDGNACENMNGNAAGGNATGGNTAGRAGARGRGNRHVSFQGRVSIIFFMCRIYVRFLRESVIRFVLISIN